MTEAELQEAVIELAILRGWRVHHGRPARTGKGWRTPITGHAGFPDLVLARRGVVIFPELKSEKGKVSPEQREWFEALSDEETETKLWVLWRPVNWLNGDIEEALR